MLFFMGLEYSQLPILSSNRRDDSWFATLGRSCIHMTWSDRGAISLEVYSFFKNKILPQHHALIFFKGKPKKRNN